MKTEFNYPEAQQVIVCGDIHGSFVTLVHKVCVQYGTRDTLVIVAGDCGFGFESEAFYENAIYGRISRSLSKANNWMAMVRGNHDDPSYFSGQKIAHLRFRTVPDYGIIKACGHTILTVGGATSIDRNQRRNEMKRHGHPLYWPDEAPVFDGDLLHSLKGRYEIDTVVTHSAPSFCEKNAHIGLFDFAMYDPDLVDDCRKEREVMDNLHETLITDGHPIRAWYYGHFHSSWFSVVGNITFRMLDIMELKSMEPQKVEQD